MLGERISALLESHNRSISDLARHCEVTPQAAHQWVCDITQPRGKRKVAIAEFFNIDPQELEYGPILSFVPIIQEEPTKEHAVDALVFSQLKEGPARSNEYKLGMKDAILRKLYGQNSMCPFRPGSCQADAYFAGSQHWQMLISSKQS